MGLLERVKRISTAINQNANMQEKEYKTSTS